MGLYKMNTNDYERRIELISSSADFLKLRRGDPVLCYHDPKNLWYSTRVDSQINGAVVLESTDERFSFESACRTCKTSEVYLFPQDILARKVPRRELLEILREEIEDKEHFKQLSRDISLIVSNYRPPPEHNFNTQE